MRMARNWGNSDSGPGGDPSWLGGKDRDPSPQSSSGWSSDFSSQPPPSGPPAQDDPAQSMAPRFRETAEGGDGQQQSQWHSDFTGQGHGGHQGGRRGGRSFGAQLTGLFSSMIGLIIFAVIGYQMGMSLWWIILVVGIPLLSRVVRLVGQHLRS